MQQEPSIFYREHEYTIGSWQQTSPDNNDDVISSILNGTQSLHFACFLHFKLFELAKKTVQENVITIQMNTKECEIRN